MGNIQEDGANLPLYENGKLNVCVHIGDNIHDGEWKDFIYDTKGNKVGESDGSPLEENAGQYELFTQEHGQHDDYHWYTVGLKDSQGKKSFQQFIMKSVLPMQKIVRFQMVLYW